MAASLYWGALGTGGCLHGPRPDIKDEKNLLQHATLAFLGADNIIGRGIQLGAERQDTQMCSIAAIIGTVIAGVSLACSVGFGAASAVNAAKEAAERIRESKLKDLDMRKQVTQKNAQKLAQFRANQAQLKKNRAAAFNAVSIKMVANNYARDQLNSARMTNYVSGATALGTNKTARS